MLAPELRHQVRKLWDKFWDGGIANPLPAVEQITYYDFDRTMVRLGLMNMVLHGIDDPHGRYADTLSQRFTEASQYDVVMTTPPFTGSMDEADKSDRFALRDEFAELWVEFSGGRAGQASVGALPVVGNCK